MKIEFKFKIGERVLIPSNPPMFGPPRPIQNAIIVSYAPYQGRPGYYVSYLPVPTEQWECTGGWKPEVALF